jgi:tetratricopeptide (TPR) repeat protein
MKGDRVPMKCHPKMFLFALLILAAAFFPIAVIGGENTELPQQKTATEEQETPYDEDEYNDYVAASKEANLEKRGTMLLEFMNKYPKSTLTQAYIKPAYDNLLHECSQAKQYALLETLAEKWLKIYPNNIQTLAYTAEASQGLGNNQKYAQRLEEIYSLDPKGSYVADILQAYGKIKNQAKVDEWTEKILKMPEYDANFRLRFDFVKKYMEANNYAKAAEYAKLTIKSADLVKEPSKDVQDQLRIVRYVCHLAIGISLYEGGKFIEAIRSLQQALKYEKHGEPYYYIGMSQWKQEKIEEAILSFARAELQGGDIAAQAKEKVEQLYKALHNNTTVGIEKIYKKAKEEPAQ